ncbi:MAG: oxidoreductase [Candidatus Roseilinea sp.]|nr:MAG: oxidoreductase [Candidatus Roseilinea sp.]
MNIAIIGAGATGLAAAYDLLRAGHRVTLFEAGDQPGGLAAGFKTPRWDWSLEKFYHHWFESDSDVLKLADAIGVRDRVIFKRPITVSYWNGRFYPLDSPTAALKFPGLSLPAKIPFGLATIYLKYLTTNWRALERYTAHAWASRWMGRQAYEVLWQPLLEGKFGDLYQQVNMAWLWARIKARSPRLGTFIGGFQAFFDALAARIQALGGIIHYSTRVEALRHEGLPTRRWRVQACAPGSTFEGLFDGVLSTTSPRVMAKLAPQLPPDYLSALNALQSLGAVIVIFALDRQLARQGYYWHNLPKSAGFPYLAMCEHTNFVSAEHFGGQHLIYCGDYLPPAHRYFSMTEDELRSAFLPSLARFNPHFDPSWVQDAWVFRETYAQPVPFINHSRHIPPVKTPLPGLFFASMSQVYPWDRGTNYAIRLGRQTAAAILTSASDG